MWKQRVGLEHHGRAATERRLTGHRVAADADVALARRFVSGDHAQYRRLAAAARSKQAAIGAMGNAQAHIVNRYHVAEAFGDRNEFDIASSGI